MSKVHLLLSLAFLPGCSEPKEGITPSPPSQAVRTNTSQAVTPAPSPTNVLISPFGSIEWNDSPFGVAQKINNLYSSDLVYHTLTSDFPKGGKMEGGALVNVLGTTDPDALFSALNTLLRQSFVGHWNTSPFDMNDKSARQSIWNSIRQDVKARLEMLYSDDGTSYYSLRDSLGEESLQLYLEAYPVFLAGVPFKLEAEFQTGPGLLLLNPANSVETNVKYFAPELNVNLPLRFAFVLTELSLSAQSATLSEEKCTAIIRQLLDKYATLPTLLNPLFEPSKYHHDASNPIPAPHIRIHDEYSQIDIYNPSGADMLSVDYSRDVMYKIDADEKYKELLSRLEAAQYSPVRDHLPSL